MRWMRWGNEYIKRMGDAEQRNVLYPTHLAMVKD